MNNPGIDLEIWNQLRKKWTDLDAGGHRVKVDFRLITHPDDENKVLMIDVVQKIDDDTVTETVQRSAGEAYESLGIAGLSMERLVEMLKKMMDKLHSQAGQYDATLTVTMSPSSPASGEVRGYLEKENSDSKSSVPVNYRYYYVLNALREKMIEIAGEGWSQARAVYRPRALEFYFEY